LGVVVGMCIFGTGVGWFVPNLMLAAALLVKPEQQGRTVGVIKAAHYGAAPACVLVIDPMTRAYGPTGAVAFAAGMAAVLLGVFVVRVVTLGRRPVAA
jgi:hypothetical protein